MERPCQVVEGTHHNRIPVEGIKLGNEQAFYGKAGDKDTDRNKATETAAGKAIVLVPNVTYGATELQDSDGVSELFPI